MKEINWLPIAHKVSDQYNTWAKFSVVVGYGSLDGCFFLESGTLYGPFKLKTPSWWTFTDAKKKNEMVYKTQIRKNQKFLAERTFQLFFFMMTLSADICHSSWQHDFLVNGAAWYSGIWGHLPSVSSSPKCEGKNSYFVFYFSVLQYQYIDSSYWCCLKCSCSFLQASIHFITVTAEMVPLDEATWSMLHQFAYSLRITMF